MENSNKVPFSKKASITLLTILGSAGVVYFFDTFTHFNSIKSNEIFWIVSFGISFSYVINYKLDIFTKLKKN